MEVSDFKKAYKNLAGVHFFKKGSYPLLMSDSKYSFIVKAIN